MTHAEDNTIALIGNPNVGKSVVFGFLTGRYATVSNYPGTTVEITRGEAKCHGKPFSLIDTPGINSLVPSSDEEVVTRDLVLNNRLKGVVQVADMKNLHRALHLSLQLVEMQIPFLLDLNMEDEASSRGIEVDVADLESRLGVPVIKTVAIQKKGLGLLKDKIDSLCSSRFCFSYPEKIEEAIRSIEPLLLEGAVSRRFLAVSLLSGDESLEWSLQGSVSEERLRSIRQICLETSRHYAQPLSYLIESRRMRSAAELMNAVLRKQAGVKRDALEALGKISMHPLWGYPILAGVLFLLYEFVGNLGAQIGVDFLENGIFGQYLNPWAIDIFSRLFSFLPILRDLFVGEYGLITMGLTYALAIVFPIVLTFFLFFSVLEDSGYLPRLAVLMHRLFQKIGLNGKAVVPMVLGLGCDTMATLSVRILETKKEKIILTLLLALGVPCSAQLGIILGMLSALPPWATFVWLLLIAGVILGVGALAARLLPGEAAGFLMEVPPLRRPTLANIITKTLARLEWYLKEVIPIFLAGTFFLFLLDQLQWLPKIRNFGNPLVVGLLGLPSEATEAFLIGFLRRDYGATRFFDLFQKGGIDAVQAIVALVVMTLFVPCLANFLMIVKERGTKVALGIVAFIYPFSFAIGAALNAVLRRLV
ncbi:MAG: ferrous iron transport protein B [Deltaproteobacteria bacterium]|nr:ferrous iron transport protein B [Deltaproteobacteria bacterium]